MKFFRLLIVTFSISALLSGSAFADTAALEQRLLALEQEMAILKRQLEIEKKEKEKKAPETPIITASNKDGFSIKSPDDSFKLRFRGVIQTDARIFTGNSKDLSGTTDTFLVRRARPIFEGNVGKNFNFYLMPDLAVNASNNAQLVDAYAEVNLAPWIKLRGGKFKAPFGLERLQSDPVANFIETGLPTNLVPNRDVGFQLSGEVLGESLNYAVGIFNGGADLASVDSTDNNNDKDLIGRVFAHPFKNGGPEFLKGLGLGVAGSYGHNEGSNQIPTYRSPGQASVFTYASTIADGAHTRLSPQFYFYKGSFGVLGEYVRSTQELTRAVNIKDTFTNTAWQLSSNYVLTGELASYRGITPRKPFDPSKGAWGAFEVVGRYGQLDIDDTVFDSGYANLNTAISKETAWALGLNWHLTKNVRFGLNYEQTHFSRGAAATENRPVENVVLSRLQLTY